MKTLMIAAALACALPLAAHAAMSADQTKAFATVQRYAASFDPKLCAPAGLIIDDFAPHVWQGPNACAAWLSAVEADEKKNGVTDGKVTPHRPWHVDVTGTRAYVVVPVTYAYKQHGKPVTEDGSVWTLVLQKQGADWRIAGWAWGEH